MIDIGKIIKRAWHILWNYKVLWIFALLLALTAGGGGGNSGSGNSGYQFSGNDREGYSFPGTDVPEWIQEIETWFNQNVLPAFEHPELYISTFIWIGIGIVLLVLIISVITAFIRYTSETAVIRMVDEYEQTGTRLRFKQGWKLGWTRRAFRVWLIDLIISLPILLCVALIIGFGVLLFVSTQSGNETAAVGGIVAAIGCTFLFFFAIAILSLILGVLRNFFVRFVALEDARVGAAFSQGWAMFKRNWKGTALMWLVMVGIGIGFGIAGFILFFLLIPAYAVMALPGAIVAAIPGLIAYGITSIFSSGPLAWIVAAVFALPVFFTIVFLPLSFISGLYMVFESNIWTLTYREFKALDAILPEVVPAPEP
jgi:hypothetical protein